MTPKEIGPFLGTLQFLAQKIAPHIAAEKSRWSNASKIKRLYKHIDHYRYVKTIWQADTAVDLLKFYYPSTLKLPGKNRFSPANIDELPVAPHVLIEGIAGQGKSIFLRFLCITELKRGSYIPIFVEFRNILSGETLISHVAKSFTDFDLDYSDEIFDVLCQSEKLVLLLDAFDELPEDNISSIVAEIETLTKRFPSLRIIVSSRKDSAIKSINSFRVYALSPLRGREYIEVINRLIDDKPLRERLIKTIDASGHQVRSLLTTPLLITMLVITYKYYQTIPQNLSQFYDLLFQLLLIRHDATKPGYRRKRRSQMSDYNLRKAFEALSFYSKRSPSNVFAPDALVQIASTGLQSENLKADPEAFIKDICQITCLLVSDGGEIRYIHRSVQEYYAAAYIARFSEKRALAFYTKALEGRTIHAKWRGEMRFLEEIDEYKFSKYALLPCAQLIFGIDDTIVDSARVYAVVRERLRQYTENAVVEIESFEDGDWFLEEALIPSMGVFQKWIGFWMHRVIGELPKTKELAKLIPGADFSGPSLLVNGHSWRPTFGEIESIVGNRMTNGIVNEICEAIEHARQVVAKHDQDELKGFFEE